VLLMLISLLAAPEINLDTTLVLQVTARRVATADGVAAVVPCGSLRRGAPGTPLESIAGARADS
jgi:hypothetical protein